ncbi:MAG TPA: endonuclease/exonuclease/phosphatase family protein [Vicinamibacterales bacterium]|nr:endonuclease/exonuclease/phosphatase family protein [Vicinamibacterales bacterium]
MAPSFHIGGWALDTASGRDSGIAVIHVWAYPARGGAPRFLGFAAMSGQRPDVAAVFGPQYRLSGYGFNTANLPAGAYNIVLFPFSSVTHGFVYDAVKVVPVTVRSAASAPGAAPRPAAPRPAAPRPAAPRPASPAPASGSVVKLLDWNIHHGVGTDGRCDLNRVAYWIARSGANVVALNEVEKRSGWCGNADQPAEIVSLLRAKTGRTWYSHFAQRDGRSTGQGNLLLSTFPIESEDTKLLSYSRSVGRIALIVNGIRVNVFSTHLDADSSQRRAQQMAELNGWAATNAEQRIVAGDFNAWPGGWEIGNMMRGHIDSWAAARSAGDAVGEGGNTNGNTRRSRIDYVFYSKGASRLRLVGVRVYDTRDSSGDMPSDHRPMLATFDVR